AWRRRVRRRGGLAAGYRQPTGPGCLRDRGEEAPRLRQRLRCRVRGRGGFAPAYGQSTDLGCVPIWVKKRRACGIACDAALEVGAALPPRTANPQTLVACRSGGRSAAPAAPPATPPLAPGRLRRRVRPV